MNGVWIGIHMNPSELVKTMKLMRRNGVIHVYTSIVWNIKEMSILLNTDAGRCIRPLYNVDENSQLLLNKSILERMDKKELSWKQLTQGWKQLTQGFLNSHELSTLKTKVFPERTLCFSVAQRRNVASHLGKMFELLSYMA